MPKKLTKEQFIAKSKLVHGNQYDYSKVNYVRNNVKVCITCPIHGDFWQSPDQHISGRGCPQCGIEKRTNKQKLHYEDFIKRARTKHGDKYDYSFVNYKTIKSKVAIICPTHGLFYQIAQNHLYGQGCPKCRYIKISEKIKKDTAYFIEKAHIVHGDRYDYSKTKYRSANEYVTITCAKHGDFIQKASSHLSGSGCPKCGIETVANSLSSTREDFITKAKLVHGDKYIYDKVEYSGCDHKVIISCREHGDFYQTPHRHLRGQGCPKCSRLNSKSNVYGIGMNDINESIRHKSIQEYPYKIWSGIIRRCQKSNENFHPSYIGCTVSNEWLYYSKFLDWFNTHYVEGWHIDKDLLKKGNKIYGSETCCFVPQEINNLFRRKRNGRNLPTGVTFVNGRYKSSCFFEGKRIQLGYYDTIEDAFNSYKRKKEEIIKYYADKWKDKLEESVYNAMLNYKVEIDD